jgi:RNA recognition motif-containing protein
MIKIFVGGFALSTTEVELAQLFSPHGSVVSVNITKNRVTLKSRGYGFLEMSDQLDATRAINALNGGFIEARRLTICLADKIATSSTIFQVNEQLALPVKKKTPLTALL